MINYKNIVNTPYTPITPYHILLELDPNKIYTQIETLFIEKSQENQKQLIEYLEKEGFEIYPIHYNIEDTAKDNTCFSTYFYETPDIVSSGVLEYQLLTSSTCFGRITYLTVNKKRLICLRVSESTISGVFFANSENMDFLNKLYLDFKEKKDKDGKDKKSYYKVGVVYHTGAYLSIMKKQVPLTESVAKIDIDKNYNDDLDYEKICSLIEKEGKCLMIFYGRPGTGKTTFIKHLMYKYESKRNFIYLPSSLASSIDSPSLTKFFLEYSYNSVFILEDAESLVSSRASGNKDISSILNASDGILSDLLNTKFIITFNTEINSTTVDEALLRKGRLDYIYKFAPLTKEKCSKFLGRPIDKEYVLADLYNFENNNNNKEDFTIKKIGF